MSAAHLEWESTGSTESPMILTPRLSNSGLILAMYPSSVVQTGVKSLGCEKRTAQPLPIHSWKRIGPSVGWASKSGASSPNRTARGTPPKCRRSLSPTCRTGGGRNHRRQGRLVVLRKRRSHVQTEVADLHPLGMEEGARDGGEDLSMEGIANPPP